MAWYDGLLVDCLACAAVGFAGGSGADEGESAVCARMGAACARFGCTRSLDTVSITEIMYHAISNITMLIL